MRKNDKSSLHSRNNKARLRMKGLPLFMAPESKPQKQNDLNEKALTQSNFDLLMRTARITKNIMNNNFGNKRKLDDIYDY